ncbi:MAG TPA: hypothetical protein DCY48_03380 [Candidatus Magasanikbacteria bacterium]|nr:MAG: hypothetical protein A3I74_04180 [Candidatus Magasanikbacteria bacterium RIFCSPLOWO2_02_FULL_47_16]OGH79357.1 MAG: hypothetical protein A3C10_04720 [Candidatus Magasanikbacteria bacterium RIFCSPHIGHO2_02_FULL_48_18]OGH82890.1 MAG: hypothetical protein A3G08_03010 [Candidatus Magasanikbacteria bacterium RIFCSPLOWO2_12_FULL_47_9b]HAZ28785.1 hypothetical protein [Candidatus Magasanikbacteria bacterium]
MLRVCFPFKPKISIGGTRTFAEQFTRGLRSRGITVISDPNQPYDVFFTITGNNITDAIQAKKQRIPIIQRLDGVYYYSLHGVPYFLLNAKMKMIHNWLADVVIYQSKYSKFCCERFLGKSRAKHFSVIYNGVDCLQFSPAEAHEVPQEHKKILFTASVFRRKDMIEPIIKALDILWERRKDFIFLVAGNFLSEAKKSFLDLQRPYTKFIGPVTRSELPNHLRSSHVFLFSSINPPCPNSVLESMSSGVPICGIAMGAMPELVEHGRDGLLVPHHHDNFWHLHPIDIKTFASNIEYMMNHHKKMGNHARNHVEREFSFNRMLDQYIEVLTSAARV